MDSPSGNIELHEIYAFSVVSVNKNTFHPLCELFSPTFLTKSPWSVRISAEPNNFIRLAAIVLGVFPMPTKIDQDLHDARSLLEQSGTEDEKRKYRKAAEIILLKSLHAEPENKEAKALLQSARAGSSSSLNSPSETTQNEVTFTSGSILFKDLQPKQKRKKWSLKLPLGLIAVALTVGGVVRGLHSHKSNPVVLAAPIQRTERVSEVSFQTPADHTPSPNAETAVLPATPSEEPKRAPDITPVIPVPVVSPKTTTAAVVTETPRSAPAPAMGTLAVSSPTAADIYQNGQLLGSTPTTLQLPAGQHTLEYRHGELRTIVTHDIKANETTSASVTFEITVQINAKPWAQVSLEGTPRHPLGQTPLSGISVPIGATLVFENPNFPSKTHRITEKDAAIQLNFP